MSIHEAAKLHPDQTVVDTANASFWDELCGSGAARAWGVTDSSIGSLRRYDGNFLRYYPYLDRHIPWTSLRGKRVLEVGLGYGTVSQKLAENGALFTGLDIAPNPVAMVNHRLRQNGLPGEAIQGNILSPPLPTAPSTRSWQSAACMHRRFRRRDRSFAACLRPVVALSVWCTTSTPIEGYGMSRNGPSNTLYESSAGARQRLRDGNTFAYDHAEDGTLAPSTEFLSVKTLRSLCRGFVISGQQLKMQIRSLPFPGGNW